jgi:Fe-S-cluster containining protein
MIIDESVPPLRKGIVLDEESGRLVDEALDRRIRLDPRGFEAARAMLEPTTVAGLAEALQTDPEAAARIAASFERLNLLDTPEARALVAGAAPMREVQKSDESVVPLLIRDDATFDCVMCGSCCGWQNIGPISDDDLRRIHEGWDTLSEKYGSARGLFFTSGGDDEETAERVYCASPRGSCVFLTDRRLCGIHAELGADAKPAICQIFPVEFVATPDGVAVSVQMECRAYHEARRGRKLSEREDELRRMLAMVPRLGRIPTRLRLDEDRDLSWEEWVELEERLHEVVEETAGDDPAALIGLRDAVGSLRGESAKDEAEASDAESLREDLRSFTTGLERMARELRATAREDGGEKQIVRSTSLDAMITALGGLGPNLDRVLRPLDALEGQAVFRDNTHNHLMSKQLLAAPTVVSGLARFTFAWVAARALMVVRAQQVKRGHFVAQDLTDALGTLTFLFRGGEFLRVLAHYDEAVRSLFFERLPALVEHRDELVLAETRLEYFRF